MNTPRSELSNSHLADSAAAQCEQDASPLLRALQQATTAATESDSADLATLDLLRRITGSENFQTSLHQATELLARFLHADLVVLGIYRQHVCRIASLSGPAAMPLSAHVEIAAALSEAMVTARVIRASTQAAGGDPSLAHRAVSRVLAQHHASAAQHCVITLPLLSDSDGIVGAIQVSWFARVRIATGDEHFLRRLQPYLANVLALMEQRIEHPWIARLRRCRALLTTRRAQLAGLLLGLAVAIGCLPVPYPVRADVTLKPQQRRVIAAPFDAPLGEIHVAPGDDVVAGQLLCTLDTEQAVTRLAALRAEAQRVQSERSGHLASRRLGDAELSRLDAIRAEAEIEQLQQYLQKADVRSPIDGVVLGEDLQPLSGIPLQTGRVLWEVAPLETLIASLEIAPDQIIHVQAGQQVTLRLEAAGRIEDLMLERVAPRGEANEQGGYTFMAQTLVSNADRQLKPGMQGSARIQTAPQPLAWCLLQRLWQRVRGWS